MAADVNILTGNLVPIYSQFDEINASAGPEAQQKLMDMLTEFSYKT